MFFADWFTGDTTSVCSGVAYEGYHPGSQGDYYSRDRHRQKDVANQ